MARIQALSRLLGVAVAALLCTACGGSSDASFEAPQPAACGSGVCVSTVAGSGEFGTGDGPAATAQFFLPHALAVDASGQVHVADYGTGNGTRLLAAGQVSTLQEDAIEFPFPADTATDDAGNRYVADPYGNRILKVAASGETSTLAGAGEAGAQDGDGASATFSMPSGLVLAAAGVLYVADMGNRKVRRISFPA